MTTAEQIGGGHFVSHFGFVSRIKPVLELEPEFGGSNPYMKFKAA